MKRVSLLLAAVLFLVPMTANAAEFAYVTVEPTTGGEGYAANPNLTRRSEGGTARVTRTGAGRFSVEIGGLLSAPGGNVQVTARGNDNKRCNVGGWSQGKVRVRCFDASGNASDASFSLLATRASTGERTIAYAWSGDGSSATSTASAAYAHRGEGGNVTVRRSGAGRYNVALGSVVQSGGHVQVTAYGDTEASCHVEGWSAGNARVACLGPDGAAKDSAFSILALKPGAISPMAFAWADQPTASDYPPPRGYAHSTSGSAMQVKRVGRGSYKVSLGATLAGGGNVQVTAYGSAGAYCKAAGWSDTTADIRCFDGTGRAADARFVVLGIGGAGGSPSPAPSAGPLRASTDFEPALHGFKFANTFQNNVVTEFDIRTGGLCGGMVYSALDFHHASRAIPSVDYRPADHTPLRRHIYDRQVRSLESNLDKWAELTINPGGARNSEFFEWGLRGSDGGRLQELRELIDRGQPAPLGLKGAHGTGDHQVLAIGYDLGRYKGDLGAHKEDMKIFVYDPNYPGERLTLRPDPTRKVYKYDGKGKTYQTYFVDKNYRKATPPRIPERNYPADGKVHELVIEIGTGDDDLRGGNDNLNLTVVHRSGHRQRVTNVNGGYRWINNYSQFVSVPLDRPVDKGQLAEIAFDTTFGGGIGGDNWDMKFVNVEARGGGSLRTGIGTLRGQPLFRFTGDRRSYTAPLDTSRIAAGEVRRLDLTIQTGNDDLRGGNDNLDVVVLYRDGTQQVVRNVNNGLRWPDNNGKTVTIVLDRPVARSEIRGLRLQATLSGGMGGDNWNMNALEVKAAGATVYRRAATPLHRFTGDRKRFEAIF